jgi:hypothetical protein
MKRSTEKLVLLTAACAAVYIGAYIQFVKALLGHEHLGALQALFLLVYFFGVIPSLLIFRSGRWMQVAIGAVAISTALVLSWMTVRWFVLALTHTGSEFTIIVLGPRLSNWEFLLLLTTLAVIALGYIILGLWIFKRQA